MKRAISYRKAGLVATLLAAGFLAVAACSNQGEGERCDSLNGDEDCKTDEGLTCYPAALLNNAGSDRCCPRDRAQATHPVCMTPVSVVGQDATTPADTGPPPPPPPTDAAAPDAESDAEAPADAGDDDDAASDAGADAEAGS